MQINNKIYSILMLCLVLVITISVFKIGLKSSFNKWDDYEYIVDNKTVQSTKWEDLSKNTVGNFHPMTNFVIAKIYKKYKLNPYPYHLFQLIFHCLNIVLLAQIIFHFYKHQKIKDYLITGCILLLFSTHPFKVESVAWISEIKDVCYAFFYLMTIYIFVKYKKSIPRDLTIIVCFMLSCMFKSMAVTLPALLMLIEYFKEQKINYKYYLHYLLLIIGIFFVSRNIKEQQIIINDSLPIIEHIYYIMLNIGFHIGNVFSSFKLSVIYPFDFVNKQSLENILYFILALLYLGLIIYLTFKRKFSSLALTLILIVIISPVSQIVPFSRSVYSERYSYLSFAFLAVILRTVPYNFNLFKKIELIYILIAICVIVNISKTKERLLVWTSTNSLFEELKEKEPLYYLSYFMLANEYYGLNKSELAKDNYLKAIVLYCKYTKPIRTDPGIECLLYSNLGQNYARQGVFNASKRLFLKANVFEEHPSVRANNLCKIYYQFGDVDSCKIIYQAFKEKHYMGLEEVDVLLKGR